MAAQFKDLVNSFLTSVHCVAHKPNNVALDTTKVSNRKEFLKDKTTS